MCPCKVQRVANSKLASAFDTEATAGSSLRRIQRLIAECVIDKDLIAKLILKLIPVKGHYDLAMDRTNWKYSDTNINILISESPTMVWHSLSSIR